MDENLRDLEKKKKIAMKITEHKQILKNLSVPF